MQPKIKFKACRNHHLYYGIALIIFGLYNYILMIKSDEFISLGKLWLSFIGIGIFITIDDIIEHTITRDTPLRIIFEKYIFPYIKRENEE